MEKQFHILLADDDMDDRMFFKMALKKVSVPTDLTTVEDGERLIQFLNQNQNNLPDVIFLDLNMPRKNGNECLLIIKQDKNLSHIPIVIYSTSLHDDVADELYKNGAHYYLQKPNVVDLPGFIERVVTLLKNTAERPSREAFIVNRVVV